MLGRSIRVYPATALIATAIATTTCFRPSPSVTDSGGTTGELEGTSSVADSDASEGQEHGTGGCDMGVWGVSIWNHACWR
jgi:hypothetical protein